VQPCAVFDSASSTRHVAEGRNLRTAYLKRWSSYVGLLTLLCAWPSITELTERYRTKGTLYYPALSQLATVPVFYFMTRYAERQMRGSRSGNGPTASADARTTARKVDDAGNSDIRNHH